ncbi:hypothetical protein BGC31_02575 [Komagataeibacter xylinus]|nr:hypothetical protein BFX83_00665 [Komagataeibacter xylinus]RFP06759.1 hypothetical protein BGC31_02575 [Komagataeibacter xylinus]
MIPPEIPHHTEHYTYARAIERRLYDGFHVIALYFLLDHRVVRMDSRRVLSGIVYVIRKGLQWKDALEVCGPHKTSSFPSFLMPAICRAATIIFWLR